MFCAIAPALRQQYANKVHGLLKPNGKLIGVLFNREFESGPPYGGTKDEYSSCFDTLFEQVMIEKCYNSIEPRAGREFFIKMIKAGF